VVHLLAATGSLLTSKHLLVVEADQLHDLSTCLVDSPLTLHHMLDLAKDEPTTLFSASSRCIAMLPASASFFALAIPCISNETMRIVA
jgi:hypothetical protein